MEDLPPEALEAADAGWDEEVDDEGACKRRFLERLDSPSYMVFILTLTMLSIIASVMDLFLNFGQYPEYFWTVEFPVLVIFIFDICGRGYCAGWCGYAGFFYDWLCCIDLLIVIVDLLGMYVGDMRSDRSVHACGAAWAQRLDSGIPSTHTPAHFSTNSVRFPACVPVTSHPLRQRPSPWCGSSA